MGTGLGVLTRAIAARAQRVITVEIDSGLVRTLQSESLLPSNVELVHADALKLDLAKWVRGESRTVRVVANLPYSAATPLLRRLLDLRGELRDWSVMLQKELAKRLLADCGSKDYGSFTVLHQLTVSVQEQMEIAPDAFFPAPKVTSSFVRVWPQEEPPLAQAELLSVERVVRAAFAQRRKTIFNCLRSGGFATPDDAGRLNQALEQAGIDPRARAETVDPLRLLSLARALTR